MRQLIRTVIALDALLFGNLVGTSNVVCPNAILSDVRRFDVSVASVEDRGMSL